MYTDAQRTAELLLGIDDKIKELRGLLNDLDTRLEDDQAEDNVDLRWLELTFKRMETATERVDACL